MPRRKCSLKGELRMMSNRAMLIGMAVILLFVFAGAFALALVADAGKGPLSFAVVATAIVTFFGVLRIGASDRVQAGISDHSLRSAIAASMVTTYLAFVGTAGFFGTNAGELAPLANLLLPSFTATVGIVIAFYFGSSAYMEGRKGASGKASASEDRATASGTSAGA
jgi:hypothetical protein